jgi:hypothetical protein
MGLSRYRPIGGAHKSDRVFENSRAANKFHNCRPYSHFCPIRHFRGRFCAHRRGSREGYFQVIRPQTAHYDAVSYYH